MPVDMRRYGKGWPAFSRSIRFGRAGGRCECDGICRGAGPGRCRPRCMELHGSTAKTFRGPVRLTTAHLCACDPPCRELAHVLALCQRCHLALDMQKHLAAAAETRKRRRGVMLLESRQLALGTTDGPWVTPEHQPRKSKA